MDFTKLDAILDSYRDDVIRDLQKWVSYPSVLAEPAENAPFGIPTREVLDAALATAAGYGFAVRDADGYAGDVTLCEGEKTLGMLCHLDVVPVGDGWTKDPFGGELVGNRLYGRGTTDDKGPAVAALHAMRAVKEAGIPLRDGVKLILGCDEETGMLDMQYYKKKFGATDYGFSPDADFPVINIEKGGCGLTLSAYSPDEEGAEIPVYNLYAGERPNVVPGVATALLGYEKTGFDALKAKISEAAERLGFKCALEEKDGRALLSVEGVSAHASLPHLGKNAAGMLFILLADIGTGGGIKEAIKTIAEKLGLEYDGASLGIKLEDEESGALTCNLGMLRFDGRFMTVVLDIRTPVSADHERMCGQAAMALARTPVAVSTRGGHPPHYVPKDSTLVQELISAYSEVTGTQGYAFAIGGGTYSRCMPNTVAFGINFPGDTDMCHMPDEWVDVDKLMKAAKIFAHAIVRLAGTEEA